MAKKCGHQMHWCYDQQDVSDTNDGDYARRECVLERLSIARRQNVLFKSRKRRWRVEGVVGSMQVAKMARSGLHRAPQRRTSLALALWMEFKGCQDGRIQRMESVL